VKLIGISGKKRSGKDTAAAIIQAAFPAGMVATLAFALALKQEVAIACGVTMQYMDEHRDAFRPIWQWWGTDFRRDLFSDRYWLSRAEEQIQLNELAGFDCTILTDVRFPNEADLIRDRGGILIRIETGLYMDAHRSETELDDWPFNYTLHNDSTLEKFSEDVRRLASSPVAQFLGAYVCKPQDCSPLIHSS
jgi:hypothetical protein